MPFEHLLVTSKHLSYQLQIYRSRQLKVGIACTLLAVQDVRITYVALAGLTGQIVDVPFELTANLLIIQLQGTSLQNSCAEPGAHSANGSLPAYLHPSCIFVCSLPLIFGIPKRLNV